METNNAQIQKIYSLTSTQEGMLFHSIIDHTSGTYYQQAVFTVDGLLQPDLLEKSFNLLIERYEIFRTMFVYEKIQTPKQIVLKERPLQIQVVDISHLDNEKKESYVDEFIKSDRSNGFDLTHDTLFRVTVIQTGIDSYYIIWGYHHILMDGWSSSIVLDELFHIYDCLRNEKICELGTVQPFSQFVQWLEKRNHEEAKTYWKQYLDQYEQPRSLPAFGEGGTSGKFKHGEVIFELDEKMTEKLIQISKQRQVTINTIFEACFGVFLQKYSNHTDVVFGSVVSGRPPTLLGSEDMVGLFINTVPKRVKCKDNQVFSSLLQEIQQASLESKDYEYYPLYEIQALSQLKQELISHLLIFDNYPLSKGLERLQDKQNMGFSVTSIQFTEHPNYDLTLHIQIDQVVKIKIIYNKLVYIKEQAEQFKTHFMHILHTVTSESDSLIANIELLDQAEKNQIIHKFTNNEQVLCGEKTIQGWFQDQVTKIPDETAIVYRDRTLTYRQLDELSNQLAHYLRVQYQIQPSDLIGIMLDRSEQLIVTLLAILKSGAAYVPIDPTYPVERIRYIIHDSQMRVLMTESRFQNRIGDTSESVILLLDQVHDQLVNQSIDVPHVINKGSDLAYVIYTSGSTGNPKGVMVTHANVSNFFTAMDQKLQPNATDAFLSVTTISFDISVLELFWTLTRGIQVVISPDDTYENYDSFLTNKEQPQMDFSVFFFSSYDHQKVDEKYSLLLETTKFADEHGFNAVWTPERHFHEFGGLYPNPSVISSALAMITQNLQLRSGSIVSPLHDSLRIAEEWSVVDNLSKGRVGLSFAPGWHVDDFVLRPENYEERYAHMFRQMEEVRQLWRGEKLTRINGKGYPIEVQSFPKPIQSEVPVWVTTTGTAESFIQAGKMGANILTHFLGQDIHQLENNIRLYHETLLDNGYDPKLFKISIMLHTFIDDDIEYVHDKVKKPFCDYLRSSVSLIRNLAKNLNIGTDMLDMNNVSEEDIEQILEVAFQRYWNTATLLGTPETCNKLVEQLYHIGVTEIACLLDFGIDHASVVQSLHHLAAFKDRYAKKGENEALSGATVSRIRPITMMQTTPSRLKMIAADPSSQKFLQSLETLLVGGEAFPSSLMQQLQRQTKANIYNMYGPTETTIWSAIHKIADTEQIAYIGKPIANTQIFILDEHHHLLPIGVIGEIYIGGKGVVKGYWNKENLTREKFIPNPFSSDPRSRLYQTGDLGRYRADGTLEFIDRKDYQVKIRGYRMELGEIETAILKHEDIAETAVTTQTDENDDKQLVAYIVWKTGTNQINKNVTQLRSFLAERLPSYMIPAYFVSLEQLPLTPNGKIDRSALPIDWTLIDTGVEYVEASNDKEDVLVAVWQKVLGVNNVSVHDNFFSLGGDSIRAIQVSSLIQKYQYKIQINDLFKYPTIRELSMYVKQIKTKRTTNQLVEGNVRLTPIQHWFFQQNVTDAHHYNHAVMIHHEQGWDELLLQKVFTRLVEHHDALRMTFHVEGEQVIQNIRGLTDWLFDYTLIDFRGKHVTPDTLEAEASNIQAGFDLSTGPLMAIGHFKTDHGDHLLIAIHHLVVDGISWRILLEDLASGYMQVLNGEAIYFQDKTDSFKEWSTELHVYANSQTLRKESSYWEQLANVPMVSLPQDHIVIDDCMQDSKTLTMHLNPEETNHLLKEVHHTYNTEINDILLTALALTMREWTGESRTFIHLEGHGREPISENIDISRTVGWFTSLYPVLLETKEEDIAYHIKYTKEYLRKVPNKGIGYGILRYLTSADKGEASHLIIKPQIMFNYLGQFDQDISTDAFKISPYSTGPTLSHKVERQYNFEIVGIIQDSSLRLHFEYNQNMYDSSTVQNIIALYKKHLLEIINHCLNKEGKEITPSDVGNDTLSIEELADYLEHL
ncbi:MupA/Atu3671 family FMN-dependent luciferase-like monooxygenase [Brevibacillus laterosporus]|uniref:MupA/Atu3671 family FMN-dependent luciferase-like monooxygenase n=1 Tax=Brevibacillus laterosporus TaxID=1465 RepID=UPI001444393C|nr:MupA/Atu3671 family FMN-dependent luciferase-like monooxygenase [Brevibacillus laterosporus]NKQ18771.1 LLM class flavin-dependent oxidoreductase [Brevibacillus laterosporus]WNX29334.1 LLM class flavin-dependent oxidoreductase [Brevibacillus laterosporus]